MIQRLTNLSNWLYLVSSVICQNWFSINIKVILNSHIKLENLLWIQTGAHCSIITSKWRSKKELYLVLATGRVQFLPPFVDWIQACFEASEMRASILLNDQRWEKSKSLILRTSSQEDPWFLHMDILMNRMQAWLWILKIPNRDWTCSLVHTLIQDEFKALVAKKLPIREAKIK